jgi:hypothetical protein
MPRTVVLSLPKDGVVLSLPKDTLPLPRAGVRPERASAVLLGRLSAGRLALPAIRATAGAAGVGRQARHRLRVPEV